MAMRGAFVFEVFLDLRKAYYALDQERDLDLLAAYGVGPRTVRLLWNYWDRLAMVDKASGYFVRLSKVCRSVMQGNPLSPTIFNVVVDAVICHCVTLVTP